MLQTGKFLLKCTEKKIYCPHAVIFFSAMIMSSEDCCTLFKLQCCGAGAGGAEII